MELFEVLYSVACDDPVAAILLFFILAIGGLLLLPTYFWFFVAACALAVLVDKIIRSIADWCTNKRKREWNSGQH